MAWIKALYRPFWTALLALVVIASVVLSGQLILKAVFVPDWLGVFTIWVGLMPEMVGIAAPVALLFAVVTVSRLWVEGGDFRALYCAGLSPARLLPVALGLGLVVAGVVGACTHWLAPLGRQQARHALAESLSSAVLRPQMPIELGSVWLRVGSTHQEMLSDVVVAAEDWVGWASRGRLEGDTLYLNDGQAIDLDRRWSLRFDAAQLKVELGHLGVHNFERSTPQLLGHIRAREAEGRDTERDWITLHKRTTLALSAPLFVLLGIPLGVLVRRPAWGTVGVVLGVWVLQRAGDHAAALIGAGICAVFPLGLLAVAVIFAWSRPWCVR